MKIDGPFEKILSSLEGIVKDISEIKNNLDSIRVTQSAMARKIDSLDKTLTNTRNILKQKDREEELLNA